MIFGGTIFSLATAPLTYTAALLALTPPLLVGLIAPDLIYYHETSDTYTLFNSILEEIQLRPTRALLAIMEFYEDRDIGNFLFHLSTILTYNMIPMPIRVLVHYLYDRSRIHHYFDNNYLDTTQTEPVALAGVEGVFSRPAVEKASPPKQKGTMIKMNNKQVMITPALVSSDDSSTVIIKHGRLKIHVNHKIREPLPEFFPGRNSLRQVGFSFGQKPFTHAGRKSGLILISGVLQRFSDFRIRKVTPIRRWVKAVQDGTMPLNNNKMAPVKNFLNEVRIRNCKIDDGSQKILEPNENFQLEVNEMLEKYEDPELEVPERIEHALLTLEAQAKNSFVHIANTHFMDAEELIEIVKPCTIKELLANKNPRQKNNYRLAFKLIGISNDESDLVYEISFTAFEKELRKNYPLYCKIFIKDEKYPLNEDGTPTELFRDFCQQTFNLIPTTHYGIKHRVIASETLTGKLDGNTEGQLFLCFFSPSMKKKMKQVMSKIRVATHEISGEKMKVRFVFTTNTSGWYVTHEFREALEYARLGVTTFLLHGDDSLGIIPTKHGIRFIENDYSSYDTSQAGEAMRAEHALYRFYTRGMPESLMKKSLEQHFLPFKFSFGKEFGHLEDIYEFVIHMTEAIRHSGAWNTTVGNTLVSMLAIYYVLCTQNWKDGIPQFDTFAELQIKVKKSAFTITDNPHKVSYLKMGFVFSRNEWFCVVLPSRILRAGMLLSVIEPETGFVQDTFAEILNQSLYGYQHDRTFPIMGRFSREAFARRFPILALQAYNYSYSSHPDAELHTVHGIMQAGLRVHAERSNGLQYTFANRFGNAPHVERADAVHMLVDRYDTDLKEILELERVLTALHTTRSLHVLNNLANKMLDKDYGLAYAPLTFPLNC